MTSRLYHVADKVTGVSYLIEATSPWQAIGHVARGQFTAEPASALEALDLVDKGVKRERAGERPATQEA